jgi:hypothetical protein
MIYFFNILISVTKVPDMQTYQNEHNMLLNFPWWMSILLLYTSKTDNNALDIDAIYNLKLRKISMASHFAKTAWMDFTYYVHQPWI